MGINIRKANIRRKVSKESVEVGLKMDEKEG